MSDLATDARKLADLVKDLDAAVTDGELVLDTDLVVWSLLVDAHRDLGLIRDTLAARLAELLPEKRYVVDGIGVFERHRKADRKGWMKDDLLRAVLDTRRVDSDTGEIETPLAKVLHVWNLGTPRVTALRERGLDADEFCTVEWGGLTLQQVG